MHPHVTLFGHDFPIHGIFLIVGLVASIVMLWLQARAYGIRFFPLYWYWAGLIALMGVGGRLGLMLLYGTEDGFFDGLTNGSSILGSLVVLAVALLVLPRVTRVFEQRSDDTLVLSVATMQVLGKVGCFFAGCCYGTVCNASWAVYSPRTGIFVHPVQLYEAGALLCILLLLLLLQRRAAPGVVTALYFVLYGIERFLMEYLRGDALPWHFGLTIGQFYAFLIAAAGASSLLFAFTLREKRLFPRSQPS